MWTKKDKEEKVSKDKKPKEKTVEEVEKQLEESKAKLEELKEESSEESEEPKEEVEEKEKPKVSEEPVWQVREVPTQKEAVIYNSKENKMYDLLSAVVEILNRTE